MTPGEPGELRWPAWADLALLLLVALALRLPGLFTFDLWQDEIYSIYEAKYLYDSPIGPGGIELRALYFWLLHPLADAFTRSYPLLRLPSLLFGLLGIAVTWTIARRYLGRAPAFLAAAIVTALPLHVATSQMIRWVALVALVGALLGGALLRALERDAARDHLRVLACMLVGTLTQVTFLLPAAGLLLGAHLVRRDGRLGVPWPTAAAWRWCWLPYLVVMAAYYGALFTLVPHERLLGEATGSDPGRLLPAFVYHLSPALLVLAGAAGLWLATRPEVPLRRIGWMAGCGMLVPMALQLVGGAAGLVPVSILYVMASVPILAVAAGGAVLPLATDDRRRMTLAAGAALLWGASIAPTLASHLLDGSRFEFRRPLRAIEAKDPGAAVLINPAVHAKWETPGLEWIELRTAATTRFLDSLVGARDHFWVLATLRRNGMPFDPDGSKLRWLQRRCARDAAYRTPRIDYERYDVEVYRCPAPAEAAP
ncbi:MAG: glycosyltransferase family 39 protein [Gemmatimonadales bacterium]|nr:glycosyltransferase family 39 protein [Gemmatimonadales bacterium]